VGICKGENRLKDITKVPAVVEGLPDMHFYDFVFQREVQESYSKPAWNTWTRTTERGDEDKPSPKKHKKGDGKGFQGNGSGKNDFEASTSSQQQGRQHNEGTESNTPMETEKEANLVEQSQPRQLSKEDKMQTDGSQEGEISGSQQSSSPSCFDELISRGGQHFTFGTFKEMEIKDIYRMQISESNSVAVNQYGTNLCKYKYDPLAVIKAKFAMAGGGSTPEELVSKDKEATDVTTQGGEKVEESTHIQNQGFTHEAEALGATVVELSS
jgi:hypothetical protein